MHEIGALGCSTVVESSASVVAVRHEAFKWHPVAWREPVVVISEPGLKEHPMKTNAAFAAAGAGSPTLPPSNMQASNDIVHLPSLKHDIQGTFENEERKNVALSLEMKDGPPRATKDTFSQTMLLTDSSGLSLLDFADCTWTSDNRAPTPVNTMQLAAAGHRKDVRIAIREPDEALVSSCDRIESVNVTSAAWTQLRNRAPPGRFVPVNRTIDDALTVTVV